MGDTHASSSSLRVADGTGERGSGSAAGTSSYLYNDQVATIVAGQLKEEASAELRAKAKVVEYEETAKAEKALSGGVNQTVAEESAVKETKDSELSVPFFFGSRGCVKMLHCSVYGT